MSSLVPNAALATPFDRLATLPRRPVMQLVTPLFLLPRPSAATTSPRPWPTAFPSCVVLPYGFLDVVHNLHVPETDRSGPSQQHRPVPRHGHRSSYTLIPAIPNSSHHLEHDNTLDLSRCRPPCTSSRPVPLPRPPASSSLLAAPLLLSACARRSCPPACAPSSPAPAHVAWGRAPPLSPCRHRNALPPTSAPPRQAAPALPLLAACSYCYPAAARHRRPVALSPDRAAPAPLHWPGCLARCPGCLARSWALVNPPRWPWVTDNRGPRP
nr:wiskott-Aldrich syndrome protein homolog 1-like [Aegilops tauschii subsp. strangulata]